MHYKSIWKRFPHLTQKALCELVVMWCEAFLTLTTESDKQTRHKGIRYKKVCLQCKSQGKCVLNGWAAEQAEHNRDIFQEFSKKVDKLKITEQTKNPNIILRPKMRTLVCVWHGTGQLSCRNILVVA